MLLRIAAFAVLVTVASCLDVCLKVTSETALFGTPCGTAVDHTVGRVEWPSSISKVDAYTDGKCVTGLKPTYGFDYFGTGGELLGKQSALTTHFDLKPQAAEFIVQADVVVAGGCIMCVTFRTTTSRSFTVGKCGMGKKVTAKAAQGSHLIALKGFFGGTCAAPAIKLVWGTDDYCKRPQKLQSSDSLRIGSGNK